MKKVDNAYIDYLIDKHAKNECFTPDEMENFYCGTTGNFVACCNVGADCFVEDFKTLDGVELYLETDCEIDVIHRIDCMLYSLREQQNKVIEELRWKALAFDIINKKYGVSVKLTPARMLYVGDERRSATIREIKTLRKAVK